VKGGKGEVADLPRLAECKLPLLPMRPVSVDALAYKWHGKTVTKTLPTAAAVRKAEQKIAEFPQPPAAES
jgi:hypothetical protein